MTEPDEQKYNMTSAIAIVAALVCGTVCAVMDADVYAAMAFSFAFGVASLPQPIRSDK
jgi:hypothetical protein